MPQAKRFRLSWNSVQWCNHPAPSGAKSKDDTPEIWCRIIDNEILNKSKIQQKKDGIRTIRREIWRQDEVKGFLESENIRKKQTAQAFERVGVQDLKCIFEALRCVRCPFQSRKWIQNGPISQGCDFCANPSTCAAVKRSDRCDDIPNSSSWWEWTKLQPNCVPNENAIWNARLL